jgi:oxaloacetate decarboxylase alpha subunit
MTESKKIGVTEVVLRDGHQSLLATRFRFGDMEAASQRLGCCWVLVCGIMGWSNI